MNAKEYINGTQIDEDLEKCGVKPVREKTFEFKVTFYSTYGTFNETAEDIDKAYEKAWATIQQAIKDLPVEVEFDIDCVNEEDEEGDD